MNITPKTFVAACDFSHGPNSYRTGDVVEPGANFAFLLATGHVVEAKSKTTTPDPKKEGSDNAAG